MSPLQPLTLNHSSIFILFSPWPFTQITMLHHHLPMTGTRSAWEFATASGWHRGDVRLAEPIVSWGNRTGVSTMNRGSMALGTMVLHAYISGFDLKLNTCQCGNIWKNGSQLKSSIVKHGCWYVLTSIGGWMVR